MSTERYRINKINSLKNMFGLDYDKSNYKSTLIDWYNRLIDKSVDELSVQMCLE